MSVIHDTLWYLLLAGFVLTLEVGDPALAAARTALAELEREYAGLFACGIDDSRGRGF